MNRRSTKALGFDRLECHFPRLALRLSLPCRKQLAVRLFEVILWRNVQAAGSQVNPFGLTLDFAKVPNRRFIDHDMAVGVGPFAAVFFIAEAGAESDGLDNPAGGFAVFDLRFDLSAGLVSAGLRSTLLVLICERPFGAIFTKAEQGASPAKLAAGLVIESVHLVSTRRNQAEASFLKPGGKDIDVIDPELDLDFAVIGHSASIKKERDKWPRRQAGKRVDQALKLLLRPGFIETKDIFLQNH
jgi:hypothetical protein